jgi:predicted enzyme related to lactoylglutathione lyase
MPRDKLKASLIFVNVPTENFKNSLRFYSTLLGSDDFARGLNDQVESYFQPISRDGIDLSVAPRYDIQERCIPYFAVANLDETLAELQKSEGREVRVIDPPRDIPALVVPPTQVDGIDPGSVTAADKVAKGGKAARPKKHKIGRMAVILDPDGNHVGLMELEAHAHRHFKIGKHQEALSSDQVSEHREARQTGEQLFARRA